MFPSINSIRSVPSLPSEALLYFTMDKTTNQYEERLFLLVVAATRFNLDSSHSKPVDNCTNATSKHSGNRSST